MSPSRPARGASRIVTNVGAGSGGRERVPDECAVKRTAKSCGPDAAVLASSSCGSKLLQGDGGKRAVHRGEHEVSRKAIAQGRPDALRWTCMLVCAFFVRNCTRDRGCSAHPVFPAPSVFEGGKRDANLGRDRAARSRSHIQSSGLVHLRAKRKRPSIPEAVVIRNDVGSAEPGIGFAATRRGMTASGGRCGCSPRRR